MTSLFSSTNSMGFWFCDRVHDYPCSLVMQLVSNSEAPLRIVTLPSLLMMLICTEIFYTFLCTLFPCLVQLRLPSPFYESGGDDKQLQDPDVRRKRLEEVVPIRKSVQEDDACCSICLHSYDPPAQQVACSPVCRHVFHKECLFMWLERNSTCPCCRQELLQAK